MADTVIRPIANDDLPRILEINQANVPEVGSVDLGRMAYLVDESAIALAVEQAGDPTDPDTPTAIVGFCLVLAPGSSYDSVNYTWFMEHHGDAMYLDRVAFDEAAQGHGLGSRLYDEVDRIMRTEHPDSAGLTLEVNLDPPNEPSLRFHAKHGFREVGRQMSKGIEVSLMRRDTA